MPNVKVIFDADTGQFVSSVDGMDRAVAKASENVAKAKNTILQWGKSSIDAAKEAGASSERLASIQERTAQRLASVTESSATRQINALDRLSARQRAVAAELSDINKVIDISTAKASALNEVPNRLKTSTVLRVSEGSTSIRGAEAFISSIPALSKLTDFVFPIASAVGFVAIIGEGVSKLKEMYQTAKQVPSAIAEGFDAINQPLINMADGLRKDNDTLANTIAKLEHKPVNGLAIALDDARINADKLAESATKASDAVIKLLNANNVSRLNSIFTGQSETGDLETQLKKRFSDIDAASKEDAKKFHYDTSSLATPEQQKNALDEHNKRLDAIDTQRQGAQAFIRQQRQWVNGSHQYQGNWGSYALPNVVGDKSAYNNLLNGSEDVLDNQQEIASALRLNPTLEGKKTQLEGAKQLTTAANKLKEQQLKALENYVNVWKTMAPVSSKAIYDFWQSQLAAFKGAPEQQDAINAKLATLATEGANKAHEAILKFQNERQNKIDAPYLAPLDMHYGNTKDSGQQLTDATKRVTLSQSQLQAEAAKTKVQIDLANGSIDKSTAAERLAAIAAQEHADRLGYLRDQLAQFQQQNAGLLDAGKNRYGSDKTQQQYIGLQADIAKETAAQTVDVIKDAAQQSADSWQGAWKDTFRLWVQDATDSAKQVSGFSKQGIDGLNDNLVNVVSGDYKRGDFKRTGHQLFKTGAGDLLQNAEGSVAKAFGFKAKPDGSKSNPLFVSVVGSTSLNGGAPSGIFAGLKLPNVVPASGDGTDDTNQVGGFRKFLGGVFGAVSGMFGGGRAIGGDVSVGHVYQINENGQELFAPSVNGRIIPHGQSASTGGGNVYYSVSVANGVTPEQMNMHVRSALQEYHPQGVKAAVQAVHDHQRRMPASAH
jgi:hypothetical protein